MFRAEHMTKTYQINSPFWRKKNKTVVRDVSLLVEDSETLGIIGASGCGKTTLARMLLKLIPFDKGRIFLDEQDITSMKPWELRKLRQEMQIIFQNPETALDPHMKIKDSIAEVMRINRLYPKRSEQEKARVEELVELVGLSLEHLNRYPSELSGGQVQRVVLARIMALSPRLLIADEPTSMLDVSVQAQILNQLKEMQQELGYSCIFISHDLDVIKIMCDRIMVMYHGQVLEQGSVEDVITRSMHPYTRKLIEEFYHYEDAERKVDEEKRQEEDVGCCYYSLCAEHTEDCRKPQTLREIEQGHFCACANRKETESQGGQV